MAGQGENRADFELRRLRKDGALNSGNAMGYSDDGGIREVQGDSDAPFQKLPPFPTDRQSLLSADEIPIGAYGTSEEYDVESVRLLCLWIEFTSQEDGSILSLVPEVRNSDADAWMPIGAVDATITLVALPTLSGSYGSRTILPAEFRTPTVANTDRANQTLTLDVGPYRQMRFLAGNVAQVAQGGALELYGSRAD